MAQREGPCKAASDRKSRRCSFSEESPGPFTDAPKKLDRLLRRHTVRIRLPLVPDKRLGLCYCRRAPKQPPISHPPQCTSHGNECVARCHNTAWLSRSHGVNHGAGNAFMRALEVLTSCCLLRNVLRFICTRHVFF